MGCGQKSLMLVWLYHKLLSGLLANGYLPRVSCQSHLSINDKDEIKVKPGALHRSPGIYPIAEETPENLS